MQDASFPAPASPDRADDDATAGSERRRPRVLGVGNPRLAAAQYVARHRLAPFQQAIAGLAEGVFGPDATVVAHLRQNGGRRVLTWVVDAACPDAGRDYEAFLPLERMFWTAYAHVPKPDVPVLVAVRPGAWMVSLGGAGAVLRTSARRGRRRLSADARVAAQLLTDTGRAPANDTWARTRALVMAHGWNATAYQILNPGIRHWFSARGDAVIGYATHARTRVVAGAPVCAHVRLAAVMAEFAQHAGSSGERVVYFGAGARLEALRFRDRQAPRARVSLGAQPWWDPRDWPAMVAEHASLRAQLRRARNKGVRVGEWPAAIAHEHPALRGVLAEWLSGRGLPPLHFLVESQTLALLADRRVFVAECGAPGVHATVVAFLVATPIPARGGWLLEQWPRRHGAPNGSVEALVDAAMRALGADGARAVTMGLAPLSRHVAGPDELPGWLALALRWARAHGRRFYDFGGLDAFKAKFRPASWEPISAIADGARFGMRDAWAIAGVFGGGSPTALMLRAVGGAALEEMRRARRAR